MIIYQSETLSICDETLTDDNSVVVVTFPARTDRQGLHRKGFGKDFLAKCGISAVTIAAATNHWFQVSDFDAAMAAIRKVTKRYRRVVTYGSSMGGYAAALCSGPLQANAIIAISPQFSVDRRKMPAERRWATEAASLDFRNDDMPSRLRAEADLHLVYDPLTPDALHAERLLTLSHRPRPLVTPFGGHPAGTFLREAGCLSQVILAIISGENTHGCRATVRATRENSAIYWAAAAASLSKRSPACALDAAKRAIALDSSNGSVQRKIGKLLIKLGHIEMGRGVLARASEMNPKDPRPLIDLGFCLLRLGQPQEAEITLAKAASLAPSLVQPVLGLAQAFMALGNAEAAAAAVQQAIVLGASAQATQPILRHLSGPVADGLAAIRSEPLRHRHPVREATTPKPNKSVQG